MKSHMTRKKRIFLAVTIISGCLYTLITMYFFWIKPTSTSYSWTQSWKEYYNIVDWNLPMYAVTDIDNDGKKDLVTHTNCAFISSVSPRDIPPKHRCTEPGMMQIVYGDNLVRIGQKLQPEEKFTYNWLKKSYLVNTTDNLWKFYDVNGLQIRVYEFGDSYLVKETQTTRNDLIDTYIYQFEHFGVAILIGELAR